MQNVNNSVSVAHSARTTTTTTTTTSSGKIDEVIIDFI